MLMTALANVKRSLAVKLLLIVESDSSFNDCSEAPASGIVSKPINRKIEWRWYLVFCIKRVRTAFKVANIIEIYSVNNYYKNMHKCMLLLVSYFIADEYTIV